MKKQVLIRQLLALVLLLVFALGNAPKLYLHNLVAGHTDGPSCEKKHQARVLHQQVIHCHCDDLVVSAPYEPVHPSCVPSTAREKILHHGTPASGVSERLLPSGESRGPPVA